MKEAAEEYPIECDGVKAKVRIVGSKGITKRYELTVPEFKKPTLALLDNVRRELVLELNISNAEILDPKVIDNIKKKFKKRADMIIRKKLPKINDNTRDFLIGSLLHEMVGFGDLEFLLNDGFLEEIVVNSSEEPLRVYHKNHGWLETNITLDSESQILNYSNTIARRVGRQITTLSPLLDAHLTTGDRANAVLYPISNKGNIITIRKFARDPWTVTDLIKNNTASADTFALIWLAMQYEMNMLISGGTGSGKTSFLNVCMPFIPPNHRLISIEDTRELQLPKYLYWCPLTTRQPNPEGKGEVSMLDLLINSLRMRPDRIVLGEIRRKMEAEVLFEAMHTGHSVYATLHADSIKETIQRLVNPPIEVPPNLLGAVNLNVVMFRDRRKGVRRTYQVGEFILKDDGESVSVTPNIMYRWKPANDQMVAHSPSLRIFEELSRHTGMSQTEINQDLAMKKKILEFMVKHNLRGVDNVGKIMNKYYLDPGFVEESVKKNKDPKNLVS